MRNVRGLGWGNAVRITCGTQCPKTTAHVPDCGTRTGTDRERWLPFPAGLWVGAVVPRGRGAQRERAHDAERTGGGPANTTAQLGTLLLPQSLPFQMSPVPNFSLPPGRGAALGGGTGGATTTGPDATPPQAICQNLGGGRGSWGGGGGQFSLGTLVGGRPGTAVFQNPGGGGLGGVAYKDRARPPHSGRRLQERARTFSRDARDTKNVRQILCTSRLPRLRFVGDSGLCGDAGADEDLTRASANSRKPMEPEVHMRQQWPSYQVDGRPDRRRGREGVERRHPPLPLVQATVNDQKLREPTPSVAWTRVLLVC